MLIKAISKLCASFLALTCAICYTSAQAQDSNEGNPYGLCSDSSVTQSSQQVITIDPNTPAEFTADQAKRDENGIPQMNLRRIRSEKERSRLTCNPSQLRCETHEK